MSISEGLQEKIVSELFSANLRKAVAECGRKFSDKELLVIVCKYCRRLSRRRELLSEIEKEAEAGVSEQAGEYIAYEEKLLKAFSASGPDVVYLVKIREKDTSGSCDYIAKTFEGALRIPAMHFSLDFSAEPARVLIEKKYCRDFSDPGELDDDYLGDCELDSDFEIVRLWVEPESERDERSRQINDINDTTLAFPVFYKDYDIVKYIDDGKTKYGFTLLLKGWENGEEEAYVISFDTEDATRYAFGVPLEAEIDKRYFPAELDYVIFGAHEHIPLPELESGSYEELSEKLKRIYDKLTSELKARDKQVL